MSAPVWLLDFDGVVNAISKRGAKSVWDRWESARIPHPYPDPGMDGATLPRGVLNVKNPLPRGAGSSISAQVPHAVWLSAALAMCPVRDARPRS